jgi:hypothetical protein
MRKREQKLWDSMRRQYKRWHAWNLDCPIWFDRLENLVGEGIPDLRAHAMHLPECWVELKAIEAFPFRGSTPVLGREGLRPAQENWLHLHHQYGGRSLVLIGVGEAHERVVYGVGSKFALVLNAMPRQELMDAAEVFTWDGLFNWIAQR